MMSLTKRMLETQEATPATQKLERARLALRNIARDVQVTEGRLLDFETADAPEAVALELAAQAMGITVERLETIIRWHEEYMRWHDGDSDYRVLSE